MTINKRTDRIDLRVNPKAKEAIQAAALLHHKTISEFVLESALNAADEDLANRWHFALDAERWKLFQAALNAPTKSLPRVEKLFKELGIFD